MSSQQWMSWIDAHLDLAFLAAGGRDLTVPFTDVAAGCISLPDLRAGKVDLVFATIFTKPGSETMPWAYPEGDAEAAAQAGRSQLEIYERLAEDGELTIVRCRSDLQRNGDMMPRVLLLMEGADPIRGPDDVATWFEAGVRIVGLTWSVGTRYAGGNEASSPLTPAGRDLIAALDAAGVIHDASHLADAALDELFDLSTGPIVATHSNCRELVDKQTNQRHLTDEHIRAIGARDGVVGLNLFSRFLVRGRRATIEDCVAHVMRVCELMGHRRGVGLGSDADGGFAAIDLPEGLEHPKRWTLLLDALRDAGFTEADLDGFREANWRRLLERTLPA